ncbi:P-loop containing nucleoside triphosphate hydrolase protein, partial [Panaeolus papilionaceus]
VQDRCIVFCKTKREATDLAGEFQTTPVTSSQSIQTNAQTVSQWRIGVCKVLIGTSIIGVGLDHPTVRDVFHCGLAYTLVDQYQQESRAGRDGEACTATTYFLEGERGKQDEIHETMGSTLLHKMARDEIQCRRIAPSLFLDGVASDCLSLDKAELCNNCQRLM